MMKPRPPALVAAYARAFAAGLEWRDVLEEAGVSRATWARLKKGGDFRNSTIERLGKAVDLLAARRGLPPDPAVAPAIEPED
jgi:hypothetical protein